MYMTANTSGKARWMVLLLLCILIYSFMYCSNNPFAIQEPLQDDYGLSSWQYSWLYSVYAYPNAIMPLISSMIIDLFGLYTSSLIFYFIILVGQTIWILSFFGNGSYPFMLIGRGLFGCGTETFHTARKILLFDYFRGNEYSLASGISLSLSRIASATQSNISPFLYEKHNGIISNRIIAVLSVGTILVYISFCLLLIFITCNKCKTKQIDNYKNKGEEASILLTKLTQKREIHLNAIWNGQFDKRVLFLGFALCSFYDSYLCFSTVGASYVAFQYGQTYKISSNLVSIPYYTAAVMTPVFGYIVDRFGHRCQLLFVSAIFTLFGHLVLGYVNSLYFSFSDEYYLMPITGLIFLGLAFSIFAAIVWPSFALIVKRKYLATALGVFGSIDNGLRASLFVVVGLITKDDSEDGKYKYVTYFYLLLSVNNFVWVILLWYYDKYLFDNILNGKELKFLHNPNKIDKQDLNEKKYIHLSHSSMAGTAKGCYNDNNLTVDHTFSELTGNNK